MIPPRVSGVFAVSARVGWVRQWYERLGWRSERVDEVFVPDPIGGGMSFALWSLASAAPQVAAVVAVEGDFCGTLQCMVVDTPRTRSNRPSRRSRMQEGASSSPTTRCPTVSPVGSSTRPASSGSGLDRGARLRRTVCRRRAPRCRAGRPGRSDRRDRRPCRPREVLRLWARLGGPPLQIRWPFGVGPRQRHVGLAPASSVPRRWASGPIPMVRPHGARASR